MAKHSTEKQALPKGRGRPKTVTDEVHKENVARAAWELLLERGYGGMTMAEVAKRARMSLNTIYRLFPNKLEVVAATVALHRQNIVALPADYDDISVVDALLRIFHVDMDMAALEQREALLHIFISESKTSPELVPVFLKNGPDEAFSLLRKWLECQHEKGRIQIRDSGITAKMLMDVAFGAQVAKDWPNGPWPGGDDRAGYLRECFSTLVDGLKPRAP